MDIVERLRSMETYGYESSLAWGAADEITRLRTLAGQMAESLRLIIEAPMIDHSSPENGKEHIARVALSAWEAARG